MFPDMILNHFNFKKLLFSKGNKQFSKVLIAGCIIFLFPYTLSAQLNADFSADKTSVCSESSVVFTNQSTGTNESAEYIWDFGSGASPSGAEGIGPHTVTYTGSGRSTVSLTVTTYEEEDDDDEDDEEVDEMDTETKNNYITVNALPDAPSLSSSTAENVCPEETVDLTEYVTDSPPPGGTVLFKSENDPEGSDVDDPTAVGEGTYYIFYSNSDDCFSSGSSITVTFKDCECEIPAPVIGTRTQPTCTTSTGSVVLTGLPSSGTWTLVRNPDGNTTTGTGTSTTISGLSPGTYTFTVTDSEGCSSGESANVVIDEQPPVPGEPVSSIDCSGGSGNAVITVTSPVGSGLEYRLNDGAYQTSATFEGVDNGEYTITVRNEDECTATGDEFTVSCSCTNPPSLTLGSVNGTVCGTNTPVTVSGNVFGGSATTVNITENGAGSVSPSTITSSPFSFTYTPAAGDAGRTVTITLTTNNPLGSPCEAETATFILTVNAVPSAPLIGTITDPTCAVATGSVILNGLPSGTWSLTRNPGDIVTSGTGTSTTISGLSPGTYSFTVTNSGGCSSTASANVVIDDQPPIPGEPVISIDCSRGIGNAVITVTSPVGSGLEYRLNDGSYQTSATFEGVDNGEYTITVRNDDECTATGDEFTVSCSCINPPTVTLNGQNGVLCGTDDPIMITGNLFNGSATEVFITENGAGSVSPSSASSSPFLFTYTPSENDAGRTVTITVTTNNPLGFPCQPATATYAIAVNNIPPAPVVGSITHPTCTVTTGSVILSGLPATGTWTLTRNPGDVTTTGTGTSTTISGLSTGNYTFAVTSASGCTSQQVNVVINPQPPLPPAPVIGNITHPTCNISTGSVTLSGLPSTGTWTLLRNPDGIIISGTGTSRTVSGIPGGTYSFIVTNSAGCSSLPSANVVINDQPPIPAAPSGVITQPTCTVATGSVILSGLPASGTWTLTRYPGTVQTTGTGTSTTVTGLVSGTYNFTITNSSGCTSVLSQNIVIAPQPVTPAAPVVGTITQPTCTVSSGSVILEGLPAGTWTITRIPGGETITGTGASAAISGLLTGTYIFRVTSSQGCQSAASATVTILPSPSAPELIITQPREVCSPNTIDLTAPAITAGSTAGLTYSYWRDSGATVSYNTPASAQEGTYYIKGTNESMCSDVKPVMVTVRNRPVADAGISQVLDFQFFTTLDANIPETGETGTWSVFTGAGSFINKNDPKTDVNNLTIGKNILLWVVRNDVCPPEYDSVTITVNDLTIPTLITPNNDGNNDYFIIRGIELQERTSLTIFDRRGLRVYENNDYDNTWDGVDENGKPLPDDTYFYIFTTDARTRSGYIVIRK
jgi:gliding motility-associated-like protein